MKSPISEYPSFSVSTNSPFPLNTHNQREYTNPIKTQPQSHRSNMVATAFSHNNKVHFSESIPKSIIIMLNTKQPIHFANTNYSNNQQLYSSTSSLSSLSQTTVHTLLNKKTSPMDLFYKYTIIISILHLLKLIPHHIPINDLQLLPTIHPTFP